MMQQLLLLLKYSSKFVFFIVLLLVSQNHYMIESYEQVGVLNNYYKMELDRVTGPESIAFDCKKEGPYVGVSDGRILKWQGLTLGWKEFAIPSPNRDRKTCDGSTNPDLEPTCGRPLGLKFNNRTCNLYIADAYFGLLEVGPSGGVARQLATSAEGFPFRLTNALDIDANTGVVYFTDSSIKYQRRQILISVATFDRSGRLLKYDTRTKKVEVMYKGLAFPNGVALSKDNSLLLVSESAQMRILKFRLGDGAAAKNGYAPSLFAELSRIPDNIKTNENGEFWIALNSGRGSIQKETSDIPLLTMEDPIGIKYDQNGKILKLLDGNGGYIFDSVSEIEEFNGKLYIGSVVKPYVGILNA